MNKKNKNKVIEIVYKKPDSSEAGGVERYAVNLSKILEKNNINVSFAYAYTGTKPKPYKPNDIAIKIPDIPFLKKLIYNILLYKKLKKLGFNGIIHINGDNGVFCTKIKTAHTIFTLHGSGLQYSLVLIKMGSLYNILDILGNFVSGILELFAYINSDYVFSVSKYCSNFMQSFKHRNVIIAPPASNAENNKIVKDLSKIKLGFKKTDILYLFVGGAGKRKGLSCAIETMRYVKNKNAKLIIAGPKKINDKLPSNCILYGRVSDNLLKQLYNASDILFFPSNYEAFGTVIVEAMSFGTVPLTYSREPFTEVVNNRNGFLAGKCSDYKKIIDNITLSDKLKEKQRVCITQSKRFTTARQFHKYEILVKRLIRQLE